MNLTRYKMEKIMKKILLLLLMFGLSFQMFSQHKNFDLKAFDAYIEKSRKDWNVPGMAVAIVRNDEVILSKGYGIKSIDKPENEKSNKVDEHTLFAIASLSKAFTTASLGILVDNGLLKWDDKVTDYIPNFQIFDAYTTREMTVRDLVTHRSGSATFGGDLLWWGNSNSRKEVIEQVRYLKPAYSFRSKYGYQNIMFLTAGEIIPKITGKSWDEFVRDSILVPLKMTETLTSVRQLTTNYAVPHTEWHKKQITIPYRNVDNVGGAAAINSNVSDLSKWMRMWLRKNDESIVSKKTKHELWTPQTIIPLSSFAMELYPTRHFNAAAMGWFTFDYYGKKILQHSGGMDGMISQLVLVPEENLGMVVLSNSINSLPSTLMYKLLDSYLAGIDRDWSAENLKRNNDAGKRAEEAEQKAENERNKESKPTLPLSNYAGTYTSKMFGDVNVFELNGNLFVRFSAWQTFNDATLTHWQYDTFQIELADRTLPKGLVTFNLDSSGKVSEMKINIPNPDFDFGELELKRKN